MYTFNVVSVLGPLAEPPVDLYNAWMKANPGGDPQWPDIQIFLNPYTLGFDMGILGPSITGLDAKVQCQKCFMSLC